MASDSAWSELRLREMGQAMWSRDSRKMASHPWWWLQQTFSERTRRLRRWAVMLVMLSAGFPGLPLFPELPIPLTVTVGVIMGRLLVLEEELSMLLLDIRWLAKQVHQYYIISHPFRWGGGHPISQMSSFPPDISKRALWQQRTRRLLSNIKGETMKMAPHYSVYTETSRQQPIHWWQ